MSAVDIVLGSRHGPFPGSLDPEVIARYAAATNDLNPAHRAGTAVPPTFPVILVFDAQYAANAAVPRERYLEARAVVHGEHDIVLHRPLVPGEALDTYSEAWSLRTTSAGTRVVIHFEQRDALDRLAVEQWWTIFFAGVDLGDAGPEPLDHAFPDAARAHPLGAGTVHVDHDLPQRYAEVSNDWSPHHFDADVARAEGFPDVFLHGLCTMAMCSGTVVRTVAGGDPARVRRVAVRFASPTYLDHDLTVEMFRASPSSVAFEATCAGATVIRHGLVELREDAP